MKRVVSVSLGSSKRNKAVEVEFGGEKFSIERIGTDGDLEKFGKLVRELDGNVDAIGFGGIDIYLYSGNKSYAFRDALNLAKNAVKTPIVDGSGLKNTLERETVQYLQNNNIIDFADKKILVVSGVDRFGLADSLVKTGADVKFGDLIFALGVPIMIPNWKTLRVVAGILLPIIVRLPFKWMYPTGEKQNVITPKYQNWYQWADILAGDYLLIKKHLPENLAGKIIITNTTTAEDVDMLKTRGAKMLITSTPEFQGRSFGTNVMEGVVITLAGKSPKDMKPEDYMATLKEFGWKPRIENLNDENK